ncbi:putative ABC transporter substrate binding protein [Candidatus Promineifilum breve]|uniref:ABC transporter substrate binding protein n=1 Tax=Candidatus Promineifilum breve TaxID=1806508 RepID=A0A170PJZ3_9CHLR|nr:ABC transporter substrate-binding protein [Candidatus Promineifilum breve]CUS06163.1 putative ABC transporter substrate binding protein [Candidatus Promineifilum breve]
MSKKWFTLLTLLIVAFLLVACGGGATETPAATEAAETLPETDTEEVAPTEEMAEPTEEMAEATEAPAEEATEAPAETTGEVTDLTLMGWSSSDAENVRLQEMVDTFNAANPDLNVTLSQVPDYDTALQTAIAGGSPPDVFYIDSFRLPDYVEAGALQPIGDQMDAADDFYPSLRQAFTIDDTFWCPPKDFSTLGLQYNTDMFDAAGLEYPNADWTWDDLRAAAEALTDTDAGVYGMTLSADFARMIAFLYQAGGSVTNDDFSAMTLDTPEALEAAEFYIGLVTDGFAAQPSDLDSGWPGEAFGKGQAAMAIEGNWIAPFLNDQFPDLNWGLTEMPAGPGGDATMAFTVCYGVAADAPNPEASIRLANWLTGAEGMAQWTGLGLAMPTRASLSDGWLEAFPDLQPFLAGADYARPWQFRPGFQDVLDTINAGLQIAFTGGSTADSVLSEAQEVGNEVLGSQ